MSNMPKLRFKEFSGEWEEKKIGTLLEFKNGINASKDQYGKGIKFINVLDILNNNYIVYDNIIGKVDIDKKTLEKYSVGYGDVLFQRSSETREEAGTANVYLDKEKIATFGGFIIRGKKIGEYNPLFINKLLKTNKARKEITSKTGGSTRYNVGQEILKDVRLLFPSMEEQNKIAKVFLLIDKKIEKQQEKVDLLEEYKKGMMQKIFSQEIRFKDENGEEYPEWEEKKFKDIFCSISTKKFQIKASQVKNQGDFEVVDQGKYKISGYSNDTEKLFKDVPVIIYGDHTTFVKYREKKFIIGADGTKLLKNNISKDSLHFLYYALEYYNIKPEGYKRHFSILKKISIYIAPYGEEQQKIADFLSKIDDKLNKEKEKLDLLKEWKKGLLQKMFV